jgi:hypothetical protein
MGGEVVTADALLARARAVGVIVGVDGGRLVLRGPRHAEGLAKQLLERKAEVLPLVTGSAMPPWDQAEADRLLLDLRAAVAQARRDFGGPFPDGLQAVVADGLAVAEGYVVNHEAETRRGWDALQLLRRVKPWLLGVIDRAKRSGEGAR